ncbi:lipopolysaccharide biosynthesis protein [Alsobacter sp. R-9]
MGLIASFLVNSLGNFALGLLLAAALGPSAFGLYAVSVAGAGALASPALDWLRHAATRHAGRDGQDPAVRAALDAAVAATAGVLGALALVAVVAGQAVLAHPGVAALAILFCTLNALFDYVSALARARFLQAHYARLVLLRNGLMLGLMVPAAALTHDAAATLAAGTAALAACLGFGGRGLRDPGARLALARRDLVARFALYGVPLMAAGGFAMVQAFWTRAAVAGDAGLAEAGRFSLAYDMGIRVVAVTATALDVLLFQLAVRKETTDGQDAARRQVGENLVVVLAVLLPTALGYGLVLPHVDGLLVPQAFRGAFAAYSLALLPGLAAWALIQFALSPAFQIRSRTLPMLLPHAAGLGGTVALGMGLAPALGPIGYAVGFSLAMGGALLLAAVLVAARAPVPVPWSQCAGIVAALVAMTAAVWPLRGIGHPAAGLLASMAVGGGVYGMVLVLLDGAGARSRWRTLRVERAGG